MSDINILDNVRINEQGQDPIDLIIGADAENVVYTPPAGGLNSTNVQGAISELVATNGYGVCSTAGDTAAKEVSIANFTLRAGAKAVVKFVNENSAVNPTLNINGTGAKAIKVNSDTVNPSVIKAGYVFLVNYNGTDYDIVGGVGGSDIFIGTIQEWENLAPAEKTKWEGKLVVLTDDSAGGSIISKFIPAFVESSPTQYVHEKGSIIKYNDLYYRIITDDFDEAGVTIVTTGDNANVEPAGIPENTGIWLASSIVSGAPLYRAIERANNAGGGDTISSGGSGGSAVRISYAAYNALSPAAKTDGTQYYIYDYPSLGGVYFFQTKAAMDAAIAGGSVPNYATCMVTEDTPYTVTAQDVVYGNSTVEDELDELNSKIADQPKITDNGVTAYVKNGILRVDIGFQKYSSTAMNTWIELTTLPSGYKTGFNYEIYGLLTDPGNYGSVADGTVAAFAISGNGKVEIKFGYNSPDAYYAGGTSIPIV